MKAIKPLKKKCDTLFSKQIRSHGKCQFIGLDKVRCSTVLQCAHIVTRGCLHLRYNYQNALCLCSGHHWYYTNHPADFQELVKDCFPSQWKYVQENKNKIQKVDYIKELERLKEVSI